MSLLDDELVLLEHGYLLVLRPLAAARCLRCGALVDDPDVHSAWHERHDG